MYIDCYKSHTMRNMVHTIIIYSPLKQQHQQRKTQGKWICHSDVNCMVSI